MKQREIYFANLNPTKGNEQRGIRPIVIISGNAMNDYLNICIACPLTSKIKKYSGCLVIQKDKINNLKEDSEVITFQIRTISKERLLKKVGMVTNSQLQKIIIGLNDILKY